MRRVNTRFMGRGSSLKNGYISQGRGIFFSELFYAHNLNALNFIPGADVSISTWSPMITYNIGNGQSYNPQALYLTCIW